MKKTNTDVGKMGKGREYVIHKRNKLFKSLNLLNYQYNEN